MAEDPPKPAGDEVPADKVPADKVPANQVPFYQTKWFVITCVGFTLAAIGGIVGGVLASSGGSSSGSSSTPPPPPPTPAPTPPPTKPPTKAPTSTATGDGVILFDSAMTNEKQSNYPIPANPSSATGLSSVIAVTEQSIEARTKQGILIFGPTPLISLFPAAGPNPNQPDSPKIMYDTHENRFVAIYHEEPTPPLLIHRIHLAISKTDNPTSTSAEEWFLHTIQTDVDINGLKFGAVRSRMAVNADTLYIASDMFPPGSSFIRDPTAFKGTYVFGLSKADYYNSNDQTNGPTPTAVGGQQTNQCPFAPAMIRDPSGSTVDFGTYLVCYNGQSDGVEESLDLYEIDANGLIQQGRHVQIGNIEDLPKDSPNLSLPNAPQKGSTQLIDAGDRRVLSAVWHDSKLWVAATRLNEHGRTTAFWVRMDADETGVHSPIVGFVDGDAISPGAWTYFPSLDVGPSGNVVLGFSASGEDLYPGAYTVLIDQEGVALGSPQVVKAGSLPFTTKNLGSGTPSPYGAYSSIALDPELSNCYWAFNQFPHDESVCPLLNDIFSNGCWGAAWGRFCVPS